MSDPAPAPDAPAPRRRRWPLVLGALVAVGLVLALSVRLLLPPERALALVLDRLGPGLGLEIAFEGDVGYRLRGTPSLSVPNVVVRAPGDDVPLLEAEHVRLALPWATIRSRGADLEIARVELDAPTLHLTPLLRWLDARPPGDGALPTFTDGIRVRRGTLLADGWRVEGLSLDLPSLHAGRPVRAHARGTAHAGEIPMPFDLRLHGDRLVGAQHLGAAGRVTVRLPNGRLDARLQLDATRDRPDAPGLHLVPVRLAADAHWRARATSLPFAFGLQGRLAWDDGRLRLAPVGVATRAGGMLPTLAAGGTITLDDTLALGLDGAIAHWPEAWPALPPPLSDDDAPLPFSLRYTGPPALDAPLSLRLAHAGARFDGRTRLPDVLDWLDAIDTGTPLPPLSGQLVAERVVLPGATLEGLRIDFDDGTTR